jgi:hypothetical protein
MTASWTVFGDEATRGDVSRFTKGSYPQEGNLKKTLIARPPRSPRSLFPISGIFFRTLPDRYSFDVDEPGVLGLKSSKAPTGRTLAARAKGYKGIPRLAYPPETTNFAIVKETRLSRPELAFIIVTRAMLGAGVALLFADRLTLEEIERVQIGKKLAI